MSVVAPPPVQDMPPPGGFPDTIRYKRYFPKRGPSGAVIFLGTVAIMTYGWFHFKEVAWYRKELERERHWARIHLVPLLQAETDRDYVRRVEAYKRREREIMSDYEWNALDLKERTPGVGRDGEFDPSAAEPVYYTERFVRPQFLFLPWDDEYRIKGQWWRGFRSFYKNPDYHTRKDFTKEQPIGPLGVPAPE